MTNQVKFQSYSIAVREISKNFSNILINKFSGSNVLFSSGVIPIIFVLYLKDLLFIVLLLFYCYYQFLSHHHFFQLFNNSTNII